MQIRNERTNSFSSANWVACSSSDKTKERASSVGVQNLVVLRTVASSMTSMSLSFERNPKSATVYNGTPPFGGGNNEVCDTTSRMCLYLEPLRWITARASSLEYLIHREKLTQMQETCPRTVQARQPRRMTPLRQHHPACLSSTSMRGSSVHPPDSGWQYRSIMTRTATDLAESFCMDASAHLTASRSSVDAIGRDGQTAIFMILIDVPTGRPTSTLAKQAYE